MNICETSENSQDVSKTLMNNYQVQVVVQRPSLQYVARKQHNLQPVSKRIIKQILFNLL